MSGNTVRALQNEAQRLGAETQQVVWSNLEGQIRQANRQVRGIVAQGQSALEQSYPDPMAPLGTAPSGPNPLSLIFGLGSVAAGAAGTYMDLYTPEDRAQLPPDRLSAAAAADSTGDAYINAVFPGGGN